MVNSELTLPLREAIHIPEAVHDADFVLQIDKAQNQPEQTLNDYVVTPGIAAAFRDGLELVRSAFENTSARGPLFMAPLVQASRTSWRFCTCC